MWIKHPWNKHNVILLTYVLHMIVKARTFESTYHIKIKITRHRVMEDACIWEGISLMNVCWVSQSVFYQILNAVSDAVFKKNVWWRNNILFKKETEKIALLQVKGSIQIIVKFSTKKRFYHPPDILWGARNIRHQILCSNTLKKGMNNWKFIFPWRKINWHVLQIAKAHFSYAIWFMISEKNITR